MKRFITLIVVMMFGLVLAACQDTKTTTTTTTTTAASTTTTQQTTTTTASNVTTVTFSSWGLGTVADNNLLRRQIAKFNEENTDIQIQIVEPSGDWNTWLTTKAAAGEFPDIVSVASVPDYVMNDWIGDISSVTDDEWSDIPQALSDSITYGDKIYAIPAAYHYMGYFANLDLLDEVSTATFNDFTYTADDFFSAIADLKDTTVTDGSGTIGISGVNEMVNWYPSILDTTGTIQQYVWNGTNFDLNGTPIKDAIAKAASS